jgi:hypothetical protein
MRDIQYAAAVEMNTNVSGMLGHPPSRVTTRFAPEWRVERVARSNKLICLSGQNQFDLAHVASRDASKR